MAPGNSYNANAYSNANDNDYEKDKDKNKDRDNDNNTNNRDNKGNDNCYISAALHELWNQLFCPLQLFDRLFY